MISLHPQNDPERWVLFICPVSQMRNLRLRPQAHAKWVAELGHKLHCGTGDLCDLLSSDLQIIPWTMWQGTGVGSEKISDLLSEGSCWTQNSTLGQFEVKACISTRWIVWLLRVHYCSVWFTKTVLLLVWAVPCWWRWLFKSRFVKWLFAAPRHCLLWWFWGCGQSLLVQLLCFASLSW